MNSRLLLAVAGWLLAAALATGTGVAVLGLLGRPLTGPAERPMTTEEVRLALARDTAAPPSPAAATTGPAPVDSSGGGTPGDAPATGRRLVSTSAGTVIARCDGGLVRLQSWTPAQGFEVDDVDPGPDDRARVKFESDEDRLEVEVRCSGGVPVPRITRHDD
ncbi:hypothetical protein ACIBI0_23035 [Microbispora rosea]|uniref:hypothetical protein n=1 Tax=Microbispora rosea TaxID=58117 RepID=UPI003795B110